MVKRYENLTSELARVGQVRLSRWGSRGRPKRRLLTVSDMDQCERE